MTTTRQLTDTLKHTAYERGVHARKSGWERLSPYYEDEVSDVYFFAGYDGLKYEEILEGKLLHNNVDIPTINDTIVEIMSERPAEG